MLRQSIRVALLAGGLLIVLTVLAACAEEQETVRYRDSPPPPDAAPVELIAKLASDVQFGGAVAESVVGNPDITEGTQVAVDLQDPGGSGVYGYSPPQLTFSAGEAVIFTLISETEFHTFTVSELGLDAQVEAGEALSFGFQFSEPGVYSLVCIPHEALGMVGTIVVQ